MNNFYEDIYLKLCTDSDFKKYVFSGRAHHRDKWDKYLQQNPEHYHTFEEAYSLISQLSFQQGKSHNYDKLWQRIHSSIEDKSNKNLKVNPPNLFNLSYMYKLAAVLCLVVGFIFVINMYFNDNHVTTNFDLVALPEGSNVIVDTHSHINFDPQSFKDNRTIHLEGRAFFDVTEGTPFTVNTENGIIKVLGTSFSVHSFDTYLEVICESGKVQVSGTYNTDSIVLTKGKTVRIYGNDIDTLTISEDYFPTNAWVKGISKFDDQPLFIVAHTLGSQYNVEVIMPEELKNIRYTGFFENNDLISATNNIAWPLNLKHKIDKSKVYFSKSTE